MKLYIHGKGTLAQTTRACCSHHFTICEVISEADIVWLCEDVPVNALDQSNMEFVLDDMRPVIRAAAGHALILISSQIQVGTTAILEGEFTERTFAYSPENIRVASAVGDFKKQARIVVGIRPARLLAWGQSFDALFSPFTRTILYVDIETAEMTKHAMNGYLAMCIAYINEIDTLCREVGADSMEVSRALKLDDRVSPMAPLKPGAPYGLGHLARDVYTMTKLGGEMTPLIAALKISNDRIAR